MGFFNVSLHTMNKTVTIYQFQVANALCNVLIFFTIFGLPMYSMTYYKRALCEQFLFILMKFSMLSKPNCQNVRSVYIPEGIQFVVF